VNVKLISSISENEIIVRKMYPKGVELHKEVVDILNKGEADKGEAFKKLEKKPILSSQALY